MSTGFSNTTGRVLRHLLSDVNRRIVSRKGVSCNLKIMLMAMSLSGLLVLPVRVSSLFLSHDNFLTICFN